MVAVRKMKIYKKAYLEITNFCNKSCSFCVRTRRKKEFLDLMDAEKFVGELSKVTDYLYLHVLGEPLLHPNFEDILQICKSKKLKVIIVTNGLKLKENIRLLAKVHRVDISVHTAETLQEATEAIEAAHALPTTAPIVQFRLWRQDSNISEEIIRTIYRVYGQDLANIEHILAPKKRGVTVTKGVYLHVGQSFEWPVITEEKGSDRGYCMGLKDQIAVLVDGTVVPCCLDAEGIISLGNLHDNKIEDIITSQRAKNLCKEPLCLSCKYKELLNKNQNIGQTP